MRRLHLLTSLAVTSCLAAPALAQSGSGQGPMSQGRPSGPQFKLKFGGQYYFDSDLGGDGEVNVTEFAGSLGVVAPLTEDITLTSGFAYEYTDWDFSGSRGFAALDPWEDVHSVLFRALLDFRLDSQWSIFAGPVLELSAESDAWDTSAITAGGVGGARLNYSEDFWISFGLGVISQLDDDPKFFPVIRWDWEFAQDWHFRSGDFTIGARGGAGAELVWEFAPDWTAVLGGRYQTRRFRLDDEGTAPDGVGDTEAFLGFIGVDWQWADTATAQFAVGIASVDLTLEDDGGSKIDDDDTDPGLFISAGVSFRF